MLPTLREVGGKKGGIAGKGEELGNVGKLASSLPSK